MRTKRPCHNFVLGSRRVRGLTFIELMIAVTIAAIAFPGIIALTYLNNLYQLRTEQRSQALLLAEETLEEVRRTPYDELTPTETTFPLFSRTKVGGRNVSQEARQVIRLYHEDGTLVFDDVTSATLPPIMRVEVEVEFLPRATSRTSVTLVTWVVRQN